MGGNDPQVIFSLFFCIFPLQLVQIGGIRWFSGDCAFLQDQKWRFLAENMVKWGEMGPPSPQEQFVGIFSTRYSQDGLVGMLGGHDEGIAAFYRKKIWPKMTFLAQNRGKWGKVAPPKRFFLHFSPANSPDRLDWMTGDYFRVIVPFYRTKIRQKMMFLVHNMLWMGDIGPLAVGFRIWMWIFENLFINKL